MSSIQSKIRYSQCWEDANIVLEAIKPDIQKTILSVCSGGCNTLSIASGKVKKVYAIDINPSQTYLAELKLCAGKKLSYDEYLEFIGARKSKHRKKIYRKISHFLSPACKEYFDSNLNLIKKGVINSGKFERYLKLFTRFALPIIQKKATLIAILAVQNKEEQIEIFQKSWKNRKWKFICKLFFSRKIMQKLGRHKKMFKYNENKSTGETYLKRAENFLSNGNTRNNSYFEYIIKGKFLNEFPHYLKEENFENWKIANNIEFQIIPIYNFLKNQPDNSINGFNLSDIFECMDEEETNQTIGEIFRTSKNGARLIFWNNLVYRDIPSNFRQYFLEDKSLEKKLNPLEKVFFYNKFYIYTVKK